MANSEHRELRILALVTDAFGGHGGIAQYNRDLLSALAQSEHVAEIVVLPRAGVVERDSLPAKIRQLRAINGKISYSLAAMKAALSAPDVVFCGHLFMAPLAAFITQFWGGRLWIQVHGIEAWRDLSAVHRRAITTADLITSVSRYTRRKLLSWVAIDPKFVKVLPNTVNEDRFKPGPKPAHLVERFRLSGRKVIITISRLASSEKYKGHDRVLYSLPKVLEQQEKAFYLIVGEGDDRPRLEALARKLGVSRHVEFVGHVPASELPDYHRLADLFVMPSTGEGFGIVFLEAIASGKNALGGNRDGSVDPLADGSLGFVIDPENEGELASTISSALAECATKVWDRRFGERAFSTHLGMLTDRFFSVSVQGTSRFGRRG